MKNYIKEDQTLFELYQALFELNSDACFALNAIGNFVLFNDAGVNLTGYSREEVSQLTFIPLIQKDHLETSMYHFNKVMSGEQGDFESAIVHKDGYIKHILVSLVPIFIEGRVSGVIGMAKNITEMKTLETMLSGQNNILEMVAMGEPIARVLDSTSFFVEKIFPDAVSAIMLVDDKTKKLKLGAGPSLAKPFQNYLNEIALEENFIAAFKKIKILPNLHSESQWKHYSSGLIDNGYQAACFSPVFDNQQVLIGLVCLFFDSPSSIEKMDMQAIQKASSLASMSIQHYQSEEKVNFMAYHDSLTNLPNRRLFKERLAHAMNDAQRNGSMVGVMYLDLDRFKIINDSLGHNFGDLLLIEVADRLVNCIGSRNVASRQGGDEFTILLTETTTDQACKTSQKIRDELSRPYLIGEHDIYITPSIGISMYPEDGSTIEDLIIKADIAMYKAKRNGRNNYQFFDESVDFGSYQRLNLENEMRKAVDRDEFILHYQPIVDADTEEIIGAEALIRWKHPEMGLVSPLDFISIAEETGLIVPIGEWVLKTACEQVMEWRKSGYPDLEISVNLSMRQFHQEDLISMVRKILENTELDPYCLSLEITESMTMEVEAAIRILTDLKKLGVKISIDDFGTGYSSLNYFKKLPVDYLKIDQSFIYDLNENENDKNIVNTIILMAHTMGLKTVAEGVETLDQLNFLKQHKCDKAQGYFFGKALPAESFKENWLDH